MLLIVVLAVAVSAEDATTGNRLERRSPILEGKKKRKALDSLSTAETKKTKKLRVNTTTNQRSTRGKKDPDTTTARLKNPNASRYEENLKKDKKNNQKLTANDNSPPDVETVDTEVTSDSVSRKKNPTNSNKSIKAPAKKASASSSATATPLFSEIQCLEPEELDPTSVKSVKLFSPSARVKATGWTVSPTEISKYCQAKVAAIASTTNPEAEELGPEGIEAALNGVMSCSGEDLMSTTVEKKAKKGKAKKAGVKGGATTTKGGAPASGGQIEVVFPATPKIGRTKKIQQQLVKMCTAAIVAGVKKCPNGGSVQLNSGHELEFKPGEMSCPIGGGDAVGTATAGPAKTSKTATEQAQKPKTKVAKAAVKAHLALIGVHAPRSDDFKAL
ncbi:hypothetical protein EX30DRAFT_375197 [Ascodesmis nigricans]|uniref:Uncharacterized protein n=1 Tax=Ascodesmis nigricans TaxID=341454 RepID=A0A4S2MIQ1_9PEZI|nr:hypothetical protein EX30DRAFT_375197 [Ascodesmis nigricans]